MVEDKAVGAFHYLIEWMDAFSAALTTIIIIGSAISAECGGGVAATLAAPAAAPAAVACTSADE